MAGFSDFQQSGVAGTSSVDDNTASSVLIESADGEDYLQIDTTDDASKVIILGTHTEADNQSSGLVGIRETAPKAPLHIVGTGGSTGMSIDLTHHGSPTVFIENGLNNSKSKCVLAINADGSNGSQVELRKGDAERLRLTGSDSGGLVDSINKPLKLTSSNGVGQYISFTTGGSEALRIDNDRKITTGGETTSMGDSAGSVHIFTGNSGQTDISGNADDLIVEGIENTGLSIACPSDHQGQIAFTANGTSNDRGAITYLHNGVGGGEAMTFKVNDAVRATIDSSGKVGIGASPAHFLHVQDGDLGIVTNNADNATAQSLVFKRSKSNTDGTAAVVADDDELGSIEFYGAEDSDSYALGAKIIARVNGTPGDGDMPTELVFAVSPDGSETPTERLVLSESGRLTNYGSIGPGDGNKNSPGYSFRDQNNLGMFRIPDNILCFGTANTEALRIDGSQKIMTNGEDTPLCDSGGIHIKTGDSGHSQVHPDWDDLVIESTSGSRTGITLMSPTDGKGAITFTDPNAQQAGSIQYDHSNDLIDFVATIPGTGSSTFSVMKMDGNGQIIPQKGPYLYHQGTGADTADTQPVYLPSASSGTKLVVDFQNGNFGDITLTAAITAIEFHNVPADGKCATVTAKITQGSSNHTIDYSDSAVTVYSDGGSTAVTGEIKFSGGVHHTQSPGSGDVDLISFTSIPNGSTFNIYAAVIGQDFS